MRRSSGRSTFEEPPQSRLEIGDRWEMRGEMSGPSSEEQQLVLQLSTIQTRLKRLQNIAAMRASERAAFIEIQEEKLEASRKVAVTHEKAQERRQYLWDGAYTIKTRINKKLMKKMRLARKTITVPEEEVSEAAKFFIELAKDSCSLLDALHEQEALTKSDKKRGRPRFLGAQHLTKVLTVIRAKEKKKTVASRRTLHQKKQQPISRQSVRKENVTFDAVEAAAKVLEKYQSNEAKEEDENEEDTEQDSKKPELNQPLVKRTKNGCFAPISLVNSPKAKGIPKQHVKKATLKRNNTIHGRKVELVKVAQARICQPGKVQEVVRELKATKSTKLPSSGEMLAKDLELSSSEDEEFKKIALQLMCATGKSKTPSGPSTSNDTTTAQILENEAEIFAGKPRTKLRRSMMKNAMPTLSNNNNDSIPIGESNVLTMSMSEKDVVPKAKNESFSLPAVTRAVKTPTLVRRGCRSSTRLNRKENMDKTVSRIVPVTPAADPISHFDPISTSDFNESKKRGRGRPPKAKKDQEVEANLSCRPSISKRGHPRRQADPTPNS